jgi:prepilin-type N-terminal cleavage/methylation domain-containing protein
LKDYKSEVSLIEMIIVDDQEKEVIMGKKGFTLIELIIVLAIISILVALSIPAYLGQQRSAARNEAFSNLESLRLLEEQFFAENGQYAPAGGGTINYNATIGVNDNGIEDILPGFRPGGQAALPSFGLNFTYQLTSQDTNGDNLADTFIARATPVPGTRVTNDPVWTIDQNNVRNW